MSSSMTPQQTLILWDLIGRSGQAWKKHLKPKLTLADEKALKAARLISVEQRRDEGTRRNAAYIEVTDAGWAWANDHLAAPLPPKTQSAGPILQAWLTHLQTFLRHRGLALGEVIAAPIKKGQEPTEVPSSIGLEEQITRAYLAATGGAWNQRVRLSDLRRRLDGVGRETLDATLQKMQRASKLVLFRLDNQREITDADQEAALFVGGEPRHLLHMGG